MKQLRWIFYLTAIAFLGVFASAQTPTGTIQGLVTDKTGAVVQGASITIVLTTTNEERKTTADSAGRFIIPFVQPGNYTVSVEAKGFRPAKQDNILVQVSETRPVDFKLDVGTVSQTIEVSATTESLDVDTSSLGETIQSQSILELPDNGRNPFDFALLVPGVNNGPGNSNSEGASTPHIGGSRNANNEQMIDGMTNILPENNVGNNSSAYTPVEDSIQELNVQTSVLPAESGRFSGGVISLVTKSGTNQFHGSFYEFIQQGAMDAVPFGSPGVANKNPQKPDMHQYQTGGTVGGPIIKSRAFFFFDFEKSDASAGSTSTYSVPNPAWSGGDFTGLFGTTTPVLFDPDTYGNTTAGLRDPFKDGSGNYNVLPASRISKVIQNALALYPKPNVQNGSVIAPGLQNAGQFPTYNNFVRTAAVPTNYWHFDSKEDVDVFKNWHSFLRYSESHQTGGAFDDYGTAGSPGGYGGNYHTSSYSGAFDNTVTFTPSLLGEFSYGFSRTIYDRLPLGAGFDPATLGFDSGFSSQAGLEGKMMPHFGFGGNGGFSDLGPQGYEEFQEDPTAQTISGSLVKIAHGHSFKVGGEFRALRLNFYQWAYPSGTFSSSDQWTRQDPGTFVNNYNSSGDLQANSGFSLASLLLGLPDSGDISEDAKVITNSQYWAFYGQDDWKVSPKLTLNIGLRYDFEVPREEEKNQLSYLDLSAPSPLQAQYATPGGIEGSLTPDETCPSCGNLLGAMNLVDTPGARYGRRQGPTQKKDFGPRFGLAYNATPKVVIRAGVGIVFQPSALQAAGTDGGGGLDGFSTQTNFQPSINNEKGVPLTTLYANDPTVSAANQVPFPSGYNTPQAHTAACLASPACVQGIDVGNNIGGNGSLFGSYRNPYSIQWNGNVQFAAPGGLKIEVGYLANKGLFLIDGDPGLPLDQLPTTTLQQYGCTPGAQPTSKGGTCTLLDPVSNPFYSSIGTSFSAATPYYQSALPLGGTTVNRGQLLKRFPQYASILSFRKPDGASMYNGFTLRADKNMSHGLTFTLAFTDGREFDNGASSVNYLGAASQTFGDEYNRKAEWGIGAQNIDYQIAGSFLYVLPFGHGREFLNTGGGAEDRIVGGWQLSGIENWSTGTPIVLAGVDNGSTAEALYAGNAPAKQRAEMTSFSAVPQNKSYKQWINPLAFTEPASYVIGNAPRALPNLNNPSYQDLDLQLAKNTPISERIKLQLRLEAFNAFNHPVLSNPDANISDSTFGVISGYTNSARRLQVAAKVTF
jgi:hypothetical protein